MNLLVVNWDPALGIDLGFFMIRYYSLMFVIGFGLGFLIMKKIFLNENVSLEKLDPLLMYVVISTILGARIGHFLFYDPQFLWQHPLEVILPFKLNPFKFTGFQGLASHGAAIAIIGALYFYSKRELKKPFLWILDRVAIPVALAGFFIRIGNLINSEIIGRPTNADSGFIFVQLGEDFPRYPTQLYEAFGYLAVFVLLYFIYWKTNKKETLGYLFGVWLVTLWSVRFVVEFWKESQGGIETMFNINLNTGQLLSIPLILIGFWLVLRKKIKLHKW